MSDRLEEFIIRNRSSFSDRNPPESIWDSIEKQLEIERPETKRKAINPLYIFISGMAASLLIGVIGIYSYQNLGINEYGNVTLSSSTFNEFQKLEKYYIQEVDARMLNLYALHVDKTIEEDLIQLDAIYQELKAELMASGNMNNHEIIEALIKNYTTKIELLEFIQRKYIKTRKNEEETINI